MQNGVDIPIDIEGNALDVARKLEKQFERLGEEVESLGKKSKRTSKDTSLFEQGMGKAKLGVAALGLASAAAAQDVVALAADLGGKAVQESAKFEAQMVRVAALTDRSTANLDLFRATAVDASLKSAFSANEAGQALEFMAMAGQRAYESTAALPDVMALAAASGVDLATSADILTNIMSGYGKQVSELSHINDVLVGTVTSSNVSLQDLGQSMKFVGPVASSSGQELEQMAAAIGLMGNAGIQGTMAGRTLRTSIIRLQDPTRLAREAMKELGLQAVDDSGKLRNFADILTDLQKAGADTRQLSRIFGKESVAGIQALLSQGPDRLREFTQTLKEQEDVAKRIERIQLDNVAGQYQILSGSVETLGVSVGGVVDGPLLDYLRTANLLTQSNRELTKELDVLGREFDELGKTTKPVADGALTALAARATHLARSLGEVVDGFNDLASLAVPDEFEGSLSRTQTSAILAQEALDGLIKLGPAMVLSFASMGTVGQDLFGTSAELRQETADLAKEMERAANQASMERLADQAATLADGFRDVKNQAKLALTQGLGVLEQVGQGILDDINGVKRERVEDRATRLEIQALKEKNEIKKIGLELEAAELRLKEENITDAAYELKLGRLRQDAEEKRARLREQWSKERKRRDEEEERAWRDRNRAELEYQRLVTTGSAELLARVELETSLAELAYKQLTPEQLATENLKIQLEYTEALYDAKDEAIKLQNAANDAEIDAILRANDARLEGLEAWSRAMEQEASRAEQAKRLLDPSLEPPSWEEIKAEKERARRAKFLAPGEGISAGFSSSILTSSLAGLGDEQLASAGAELEGLQSVDASKMSEAARAAHELRIKQTEARVEAIQRENEALSAQLAIYERIGSQAGSLATSIGEIATAQWDSKEAADAANAALAAGSQILGASLEAAGVGIKEQAKWRAVFEGAAAIAAGAGAITTGNPAFAGAAIQHGIAAAQFGLIAGGVIGSSTGAGASVSPAERATASSAGGFQADIEREKTAQAFARAMLEADIGARAVVINVDFGQSIHADGYDAAQRAIYQAGQLGARNSFDLARTNG